MDIPLVKFLHFDKEIFSQHTNCIPRVGETITIVRGENRNMWTVQDVQYVYSFRPAYGYLTPSVIISVVSHERDWPEDVTLPPESKRQKGW
ncbi:MAG: hypothetical protein HY819_09695 [Acidobacteria bacterium]|nr:hypothetical protein [Acidobacteriota bacterium]